MRTQYKPTFHPHPSRFHGACLQRRRRRMSGSSCFFPSLSAASATARNVCMMQNLSSQITQAHFPTPAPPVSVGSAFREEEGEGGVVHHVFSFPQRCFCCCYCSERMHDARSLFTMAVRVVEFSNGVYKVRKIFANKSTYAKGNY